MSFYVKTNSFIDTFTDSGFLLERMPHVQQSYEIAEQWREIHNAQSGKAAQGWLGPELKHVASIDPGIGTVAMDFDWNIFENEKKFYAWLRKHPECKAVK